MFPYDVLCVGSATVDHFLNMDVSFKKIKVGDKVLVHSRETQTGGGATNATVAFARLGLNVKVLTKLGSDHEADFVLQDLSKYGVKNICLHRSKKPTDYSTLVYSTKDHDRVIFVHKAASSDLQIDDFKHSQLNTRWFYFASLVGDSFNTTCHLTRFARQKKIPVLFNPSLYLAQKGVHELRPILDATTVLVLNKEEAQALFGVKSASFDHLLKSLQKLGPKIVVITDGERPFWGACRDERYIVTPPHIKTVHTVGAGDAFTAGFLAGLIKKWPFVEALKLGQVNASMVIQHVGAKKGLLTEKEAGLMLRKLSVRVEKR